MNKKTIALLLTAIIAMILISGCIPEDSLEWSQDGSIGLMRVHGALYLVNGQNGQLSEIEKDNVQPWPGISKDTQWLVYSRKIDCNDLSDGLKQLSPGQVKIIEYYAKQVEKQIADNKGLVNGKFPFPEQGLLAPLDYRNWAIRYACEKYGKKISTVLTTEQIQKAKESKISYFQIIAANRNDPAQKKVITTGIFAVSATKFSPNAKFISYLMHTQQGQVANAFEEQSLYVASVEGNITAAIVDHPVAFGYSWRNDNKTIAYWKADSKNLRHDDSILGELKEKTVLDANDNLLVEPAAAIEQGNTETHRCTGGAKQIAGSMFYPWMKADYSQSGRLFFASIKLTLPTGNFDNAKWSLFCYDPATKNIADVLPTGISETMGQITINSFSLSPDGGKVLLPMKKNRFAIYELGAPTACVPVDEKEGFGEEETLELAPAWKGNTDISCLVSESSYFLREEKNKTPAIVIIDTDGRLKDILSKNWPPNIMNKL
jgi:hypothetical protein